jgi:glycine/D-amino acid oxidase-like deaminating enzyme
MIYMITFGSKFAGTMVHGLNYMQQSNETADIVVVGGGMVGSAIAFGVADRGARVILLDEGDGALRAARGNFGLVWYQGKGRGMRQYQEWSLESTRAWPAFADDLLHRTGIDVSYKKTGGFVFCLTDKAFEARRKNIEQLRREALPQPYDCKMLDRKRIQEMLPEIRLGDTVIGGSYSPRDGHANPLALLTAMHGGFKSAGGRYYAGCPVIQIRHTGDRFVTHTPLRTFASQKLILAAGNGTGRLAAMIGMKIPVRPQKGQLLITERTLPVLRIPSHQVRQTSDGSFQLGYSQEEVGFDTRITTGVVQDIASTAVKVFPVLAGLRIVRGWAALRVMTPDGMPIYEESAVCPGAFVVALHSGVTLAALHATRVADWILEGTEPQGFAHFRSRRFHV